ncbi:MAG: hypothetical protein ABJA64_02920 [Candidatus Saccharibacteria bacterium]
MTYLRRPFIFVLASVIVLACFAVPAKADDTTITDAQLVQIRGRCTEIQTTLDRIHSNDALLRVNRGQLYELISTKLMARLNSRIALNHLDGSSLVSVASNYESHLNAFRVNYQLYEEALSNTIKTNCTDQPVNFYNKLQEARSKRADVLKSIQDITDDISSYQDAFDAFAQPYRNGTL